MAEDILYDGTSSIRFEGNENHLLSVIGRCYKKSEMLLGESRVWKDNYFTVDGLGTCDGGAGEF